MRSYVLVALAGCFALSCGGSKPSYDASYPRSGAYQTGAYKTQHEEMKPASGVVVETETVEEYGTPASGTAAPSNPLDEPYAQGVSVDDQRTTEKIRQSLINDDSLSFDAKNVKVITLHNKVTLRGPVLSTDEALRVEAHAKTIAGADNVDNQLEIKKPQ